MEYFVVTIIAIGGLLFVGSPLFTSKKYALYLEDMFDFGDERQLNYLNARKQLVYENIKELDFEHEMGKLAEEDYTRLRQGYLMEAQEVLKAVDKLKIKEEIEELIEGEVRSRRRIE